MIYTNKSSYIQFNTTVQSLKIIQINKIINNNNKINLLFQITNTPDSYLQEKGEALAEVAALRQEGDVDAERRERGGVSPLRRDVMVQGEQGAVRELAEGGQAGNTVGRRQLVQLPAR